MDNIKINLKYLGEDQNPNILLLPNYCHLHQRIYSELECSSFQDAVSNVLAQTGRLVEIIKSNEIISIFDVAINVDIPRNFEDEENFEFPKIHGVAKILEAANNNGNVEDPKIGEIF
jgi:hypothetical protein